MSSASTFTTSVPQPKPRLLIGNVPDVGLETPVQEMMRLGRELGPVYRLQFPGRNLLIVGKHAWVSELSDESRFEKHLHGPLVNLQDLAGDALFTAETRDPNWEKAHRLLTPAFGPLAIKETLPAMIDIAEQMIEKWARLGPHADLDVADNMTRLTLDTIALSGFDFRFNSFYQREMHPFVDAMTRSLAEASARTRRLPIQTRLMILSQRQYERDLTYMFDVVDKVIEERRKTRVEDRPRDLLGLMLEGKDPLTGLSLSDVNIRSQIVTFLIAGHETTSGLLTFAIHFLLEHPEVLARATEEVDRVLGDKDTPSFEDLARLTYLDQVLRETLRIWPTAPAYAVHPLADTTLGGTLPVKKGDEILVLTPLLHRDESVWTDPETFDPSRFDAGKVIPMHAWKPFGNGVRACIGRAFSMQEATLVLALVLRRFEMQVKGPYRLRIKETLTLKPDGLHIRVKERRHSARTEIVPMRASLPPAWAPSLAAHGTPLLVLFGSNSGSSEAFAKRIANDATLRGYRTTLAPLDAYAGKLDGKGAILIVTASYNGLPPDNAKAFLAWLDAAAPGSLQGTRYAVFGCGHRDWAATYQAVPRAIDEGLARAGGERLLARGEADAGGDFFGAFEAYRENALPTLDRAFGIESQGGEPRVHLEVERVEEGRDPLARAHAATPVTVLENRELVDTSATFGRSKRHVTLELGTDASYRAGDYLAVLGENDSERVLRAAGRFGLDPAQTVRLRGGTADASHLPLDLPIAAGELLARYVELGTPATRGDVRLLAKYTHCPPEKKRLLALAGEGPSDLYVAEIFEKRTSVLDLLLEFEACEIGFGEFLELLPPMKPRRYSISSSPLEDPSRCSLTVAVVEGPAFSGKGTFRGTASTHLARAGAGSLLFASVVPSAEAFHLPADSLVPIVLVGAGTGLAPLRGFLEERKIAKERGAKVGPAALFFGCDHPDVDFLYREELRAWEAAGVVSVYPAFFRAPEGEISFVQHRLLKERETVADLLRSGARVFVCGDGKRMAPAVRAAFATIAEECLGEKDGAGYVSALEEGGRYAADVFTG